MRESKSDRELREKMGEEWWKKYKEYWAQRKREWKAFEKEAGRLEKEYVELGDKRIELTIEEARKGYLTKDERRELEITVERIREIFEILEAHHCTDFLITENLAYNVKLTFAGLTLYPPCAEPNMETICGPVSYVLDFDPVPGAKEQTCEYCTKRENCEARKEAERKKEDEQ